MVSFDIIETHFHQENIPVRYLPPANRLYAFYNEKEGIPVQGGPS